MSRLLLRFAACALCLAPRFATATDIPAHGLSALTRTIDAQLAQPRFAHARWGLSVVSLDSGRTVYAHDADRLFEPASTAKLFTAALVLSRLDPAYRIPTRLLGPMPRHGRLRGPLVLYGMGDPSLGSVAATLDWADRLAEQLAVLGVRRIDGDLVADDSYFSGPPFAPGWEVTDLLAAFAAPASALASGENAAEVTVAPGDTPGEPARVTVVPAEALDGVDNRLATTATGDDDINLYRAAGGGRLRTFGQVRIGAPPHRFRLAVADPARTAGRLLQAALARHRIRLDGQLRVLHWPTDDGALRAPLATLAEVRSPPVADLLRDGLKRSQNLYLENLLQLAGKRAQADAAIDPLAPQGFLSSRAWAMRALHALLERIGVPPEAGLLEEGTGLSRRDLVTPAALVRVLGYLASQPDAAGIRDMLPVAGVDGTLAGRLRGTAAAGDVHAKTGSMAQVNTLAGYVTTAAGEHLAFALMLNHYQRPPGAPPAHAELDAIAVALARLDQRSDGPGATSP